MFYSVFSFVSVVQVSTLFAIISFCECFTVPLKRVRRSVGEDFEDGREHVTVGLTRFANRFHGLITVGTARDGEEDQEFVVVFDTGSKHLWLTSADACPKGDCSEQRYTPFYGIQSKTYEQFTEQFKIKYEDKTIVEGHLAKDNIKLGTGDDAIVIKGQIFGEVDNITNGFKEDGIFGLGLWSADNFPGQPDPPFMTMIQQVDMTPVFGFYFNRNEIGPYAGELIFGGHDHDKFVGDFSSYKVVQKNDEYMGWRIQLRRITVREAKKEKPKFVLDAKMHALLDSGTEVIVGPQKLMNSLNSIIFKYATFRYSDEFVFSCLVRWELLPTVTVMLGDKEFTLSPEDYIWKCSETRFLCQSAFYPLDIDYIILGQPFLAAYYTRFDMLNLRVQIARARHSSVKH